MTNEEFKPENFVWTEKYRPKKVSEMVGDFKDKIKNYLKNPKSVPHFLLYSRCPGTGKTTLAKAIINELDCDSIIINSSDDRKIDVIRNKVKEFSIAKSSKPGVKRCVFLDECDGMLKTSQNALRNIMETYANNVFFILTANSVNRIIQPLRSRCKEFCFAYPNREEICVYLKSICMNENMKFTDEALKKLVDLNYPSIRDCVIALQDLYTENKNVTIDTVQPVNKIFDEMWVAFKQKDWTKIKEVVMSTTVDPCDLNKYFWEKAVTSKNVNKRLVQILCRNEKDIQWGADAKIVFVTSIIEMLK